MHLQVILSLCEHHRVTYTNRDSVAYYTPGQMVEPSAHLAGQWSLVHTWPNGRVCCTPGQMMESSAHLAGR